MHIVLPITFSDILNKDIGVFDINSGSDSELLKKLHAVIDEFNKTAKDTTKKLEKPHKLDKSCWNLLYRKLILRYHPDKNKTEQAQKNWQVISAINDAIEKENQLQLGVQIEPNSKALRVFSCCVDIVVSDLFSCAAILFAAYLRLKQNYSLSEAISIFIGVLLIKSVLIGQFTLLLKPTEIASKDKVPEILTMEQLREFNDAKPVRPYLQYTFVKRKLSEDELKKLYESLKKIKLVLIKNHVLGKKLNYLEFFFHVFFITAVCAFLGACAKFDLLGSSFGLDKSFYSVSAVCIAAYFSALLLVRVVCENFLARLWPSLICKSCASFVKKMDDSPESADILRFILTIFKCNNKEEFLALSASDATARLKDFINELVKSVIVNDDEKIANCVKNKLISGCRKPKDFENELRALVMLDHFYFAAYTLSTVIADVKLKKAFAEPSYEKEEPMLQITN